ncbi:TolC family protein, partial [Bacteroidota bacterium]
KLTLNEAIKIALQRNSTLVQTKNSIESNKSQLKSAYGDLMPNLGVNGSWGWQRIQDAGGKQLNYYGEEEELPASTTDSRNWSLSAGGGFTLFNGLANYANISQSKNTLEAAEFSLEKLKQDIIYQTTEFYYSVLNTDAIRNVREENVKYNEKLLETIQERNKLGSVPIADVYAQQVQLGNAELLLIQAENDFDQAKITILNFLALDVLDEYEFIDPFENIDKFYEDLDLNEFNDISSMVAEALNLRLDYKSQLLNLESADDGITIAKSGLYPRLTGSYSYVTSALRAKDLFNRESYNIGMTLSIPIFSNWDTENQIQFAEVQYKNTQEDVFTLERQIKIEVKQGYLNLLAAKKSLEVARKNVVAGEENRRINYERYSLGSGTILDVLQSDRDFTQALSDRINAEFEFYKGRDNLLNALGKLDYKKFE